MARPRRKPVREADLKGFKYFKLVPPLLERLHDIGTARDKAGNRQLFFDQYVALLLLYFFNPIITSLRALQQATELDKVQRLLGVGRQSLGSLSEATEVFRADVLRQIVQELAQRAMPLETGRQAEALAGLTAVDGSVLPALSKMIWAMWKDAEHRAVRLHLHFDVLKGVPCDALLSPAACSEPAHLKAMLQPGRFYVMDRGYASYELLQDILRTPCSFVLRVKENVGYGFRQERPLSEAARAAGVTHDIDIFRLGQLYGVESFQHPLRLVIVRYRKADGTPDDLWLLTDRLELPPELVALVYRYRWTVELFFRWFKCVLGCRHLVANDANGVAIQCYVALIVSLLIVLWLGRKPNKRTWEMIQYYLIGWASLDELTRHLSKN